MVFNLFSAPCFGAIGAMKKELGGIKKTLKAITFQTSLSWVLSSIVYQVGRTLEIGKINFLDLTIILVIIVISVIIIKQSKKHEKSRCLYCNLCNKNTSNY